MGSTEGGVDIEEVAETNPKAIHKQRFYPSEGLGIDKASSMAISLGLSGNLKIFS